MLVGITYDLKEDYLKAGYSSEESAEFDSIETIDAIEESLKLLKFSTVRIGNVQALVTYLAQGKRCDLVFNIAEGLRGMCREAQIPALLDAYAIPYVFSDSFVLAIALHKGITNMILRQSGVPVANSHIVSSIEDLSRIRMTYPLFVKPVGGGTGMGIDANSIVNNTEELRESVLRIREQFGQEALIETYLPGREFTVGITGTGSNARPVAVMEIIVDSASDQGIYSYHTKQQYKQYARYQLASGAIADECCNVALSAWNVLGCRDGGRIDVKADSNGNICFLEVNPLAGLNPVDSDLPILAGLAQISYHELIGRIMESAMKRIVGAYT